MMKTVILDIDGTLADLTHRLHHVKNGNRNWDVFFAEADKDLLHEPIGELVWALSSNYRIVLVSGRPEKIRGVTEEWCASHGIYYEALYMRPDGDHRPDTIIKSLILDRLLAEGHDIAFVIDDRPSVVGMWRERGLTCLQCREWNEETKSLKGLLTLMVGPTCAGKSTWLQGEDAAKRGILPAHILSSDQIRGDLCGDRSDQSKNDEVFIALHAVAKERLRHGLPTVIDATNIRRKDRLACVGLNDGGPVRYIVLDRPLEEKLASAGKRRPEVIERHDNTFKSQIKDILAGDEQPNVTVIDGRVSCTQPA